MRIGKLGTKRSVSRVKLTAFLLLLVILVLTQSCKKTSDVKDPINVGFVFEHTVDTAPLVFDSIAFTNAAGNNYSVVTLKYFISDIVFHRIDGVDVKIDDEHYIDAKNSTTLSYKPYTEVPYGTYTAISFVFGLDTVKNISGRFPNLPESNMAWPASMGGGYHYMKMEGKYDSSGVIKNYNVHTGATMGMPHHINITLSDQSFVSEGNDLTISLNMDINKWFDTPTIYDFNIFGAAIMGNMTAQMALKQNGANVFSVNSIE